ncbi:MAG: cytochrome c, partial [Myxococcales bacterium]|nr:cytochrome c [Myxococcales bacterium]
AMNRQLLCLIAIAVLAMTVGCASENPRVPTIAALSANSAAGELVYQEHCTGCHGENLKGAGKVPNLIEHASGHGKEDLLGMLLDGGDGMPPFDAKLTDQQAADVICYVEHKSSQ